MLYTPLTKKALRIAFQAHKDQLDKSGLPYVFHPFHLAEQMHDEATVCTALLHDVAEDTAITVDQLAEEGFPAVVINALRLLTHNPTESYFEYVRKIRTNPVATAVKLADLRHNSDLTRLDFVDDEARQRVEKYKTAIRILTQSAILNRFRGCLIGGAAGDALGYAVEFTHEEEIFSQYGPGGIRDYALDPVTGKALISDDTQMTLFTLSGLLFGWHRSNARGVGGAPRLYVAYAYQGWLNTQKNQYSKQPDIPKDMCSAASCILLNIPELYHRRAPGITCLSALETRKVDMNPGILTQQDYLQSKINNSKGCGGVMRVAPLALALGRFEDLDGIDQEGAQLAAITHSHSLGYMPAAVLVHIISRIVYPAREMTLRQIVEEARDTVARLYQGDPHIQALIAIINQAISLSESDGNDLDNIHQLGEGWVAEETLAIAIYCSLKYQYDFSQAIIAAANHNGDSDSTAAVTGNILGAYIGYEAIDSKWKENLELHDLILQAADQLYDGYYLRH